MKKQKLKNGGFSFIELLIAMALLSIIMLMVVNFMSTTSGAYRKTKKNLNIQTEAMQVSEQISDNVMQAAFIRISAGDGKLYTVEIDPSNRKHERVVTEVASGVDCDFVPDNYGNYVRTGDPMNMDEDAIVNLNTYRVVNSKGQTIPAESDDRDVDLIGVDTRSFRALNHNGNQYYVQPDYIYMEYRTPSDDLTATTPSDEMQHVLYQIIDDGDNKKIYTMRYTAAVDDDSKGYKYAVDQMNAIIAADGEGLLTSVVKDFYVSVDVDRNALLTNILFEDQGYQYNTVENINFRNSNVLSVRPQRLYKVKGDEVPTTATTQAGGSSTENSTEKSTAVESGSETTETTTP